MIRIDQLIPRYHKKKKQHENYDHVVIRKVLVSNKAMNKWLREENMVFVKEN